MAPISGESGCFTNKFIIHEFLVTIPLTLIAAGILKNTP